MRNEGFLHTKFSIFLGVNPANKSNGPKASPVYKKQLKMNKLATITTMMKTFFT